MDFNPLPIGEQLDPDNEDTKATREYTPSEIASLEAAANRWNEILKPINSQKASVVVVFNNTEGAAALSNLVVINGENYQKSYLNAVINNLIFDDSDFDEAQGHAQIFIGSQVDGVSWDTSLNTFVLPNISAPNLKIVAEHEIFHALGLISEAGTPEEEEYLTFTPNGGPIGVFDKDLRISTNYDGSQNSMASIDQVVPEADMLIGEGKEFDIVNHSPYYVGLETLKVLTGTNDSELIGKNEEQARKLMQEKIADAGGLVNYSTEYDESGDYPVVLGLPIHPYDEPDEADLSHVELRNSFMSHQNYRNWGTLMEAELALLKDIGYENIEIRDHFGKSFYLNSDGDETVWRGHNDSGIGFGKWNGTEYEAEHNTMTAGVGLHIYGDNYDLVQKSDILLAGDNSVGVRIDGVENNYTLASGSKIEAIGTNNVGVMVAYGKNHNIAIEEDASINATGKNGIGLAFDFGLNMIGENIEHRGSYLDYKAVNNEYIATPEDINGALVKDVYIDGAVVGEKAAIYIADNAYVENINISDTAQIKGDIISNWNSIYNGSNNAAIQAPGYLVTSINFTNTDEDSVYEGFEGKIYGNKMIVKGTEVYPALRAVIKEGAVALNDTIDVAGLKIVNNQTNTAKLISNSNVLARAILNEGALIQNSTSYIDALDFQNVGEFVSKEGAIFNAVNTTNNSTMEIGGVYKFSGNIAGNGEIDLVDSGILSHAIQANSDSAIIENTVLLNGGSFSMLDNKISNLEIENIELNDNSQLGIDLDFATQKADTINVNNLVVNDGSIDLSVINIMNQNVALSAKEYLIDVLNAENLEVNTANELNINVVNKEIYSPIFKYQLKASQENPGALLMSRGSSENHRNFNPAILAAPVAAQVGGYLTQLHTYDMAFANMDMNMLMSYDKRQAMKFRNKYAMSGVQAGNELVTFGPNQLPEENKGAWFKPFATFEEVNLSNGPKVENQAYGSFFGVDSEIITLKNGWDGVFSGYVGYTGSHQRYAGSSIYQNGGTLGASGVFYKGNFFTGLTANIGASMAEASTMYGSEDITMLMTGIASKSGYNWELANNKFIIQPSWLMSYSFVNTFNYHNAAGVVVNADPLHAIQLVPGLKFIGNLNNGWQPYASVQMVWNLMDDTKFQANDVALPQMSVDPYVQYGIGLQKLWGDRFTGFGQALIRNGGRNGIALSLGFRWMLGKN